MRRESGSKFNFSLKGKRFLQPYIFIRGDVPNNKLSMFSNAEKIEPQYHGHPHVYKIAAKTILL